MTQTTCTICPKCGAPAHSADINGVEILAHIMPEAPVKTDRIDWDAVMEDWHLVEIDHLRDPVIGAHVTKLLLNYGIYNSDALIDLVKMMKKVAMR